MPVLFIEQDVDQPLADRVNRWFDGYGSPGTVYLPLVMVDSGNRVSNGSENFEEVYGLMVDSALRRPTTASMTVAAERDGNDLHFDVRLSNHSGMTLSADNNATLTALVYEEPASSTAVPLVAAADTAVIAALTDGATGDFSFDVDVSGLDPDLIRWVVIADHQPIGSSNPFDTLQAVAGP